MLLCLAFDSWVHVASENDVRKVVEATFEEYETK